MIKVTLTVATALLSMNAMAQHKTYVIPALNEKMVKALPYYFYLDTAHYKVKYRNEPLPVEDYKGRSRYVLTGYKSGELSIEKISKHKRKPLADTSIYLRKELTFADPKLLVYLNGTEPGKQFRVATWNHSRFELRAYVEGSTYEQPLVLDKAEVRFQKNGKWVSHFFEQSNVVPDWLMKDFFASGAAVMQVQPQYKWHEDDLIAGETVEFYFDSK